MAFVVASDRWSRAGTLIHMKFLARGWPVLMIALVLAACGSSATGRDDPAYDGVLRYCEHFAAAAPVRLNRRSRSVLRCRQHACRSHPTRRCRHAPVEYVSTFRFQVCRRLAVPLFDLHERAVLRGGSVRLATPLVVEAHSSSRLDANYKCRVGNIRSCNMRTTTIP